MERHDEATSTEIAQARQWIDAAQRIVVLTGAGISTESGIRDFRGPNGVWTRNPEAERTATLAHYMVDHDLTTSPITTSDGRLVGVLRREDALRAAHGDHDHSAGEGS